MAMSSKKEGIVMDLMLLVVRRFNPDEPGVKQQQQKQRQQQQE